MTVYNIYVVCACSKVQLHALSILFASNIEKNLNNLANLRHKLRLKYQNLQIFTNKDS